MEEAQDVPAFAVPSEYHETVVEDSADEVAPAPSLNEASAAATPQLLLDANVSSEPVAVETQDLLGFGSDVTSTTPGPVSAESHDLLDLFSSPAPSTPMAPTSTSHGADPFLDFVTPPAQSQDPAVAGVDGTKDSNTKERNLSSPTDAALDPTPTPGTTNHETVPEASTSAQDVERLEEELSQVKQQLEISLQKNAQQSEQMANLQAALDMRTDSEAATSHVAQEQEESNSLQQQCDDKDRLIEELRNQLAASTAVSSEKEQEALHRLQKKLEDVDMELQRTRRESDANQRRVEQEYQQQVANLEKELTDAKKHADGLKTDQARYRELQSLWTAEQTKRTEAESRAVSAERTIDELRELLDDQGCKLKQMQDKVAAVKKEAEEKIRVAEERMQELELAQAKEMTEPSKQYEADVSEALPDSQSEVQSLKDDLESKSLEIERLETELNALRELSSKQQKEFDSLKADHDEQHRREMALTNRLNAAKKVEAEKVNLAERLEDELKAVKEELDVRELDLKNLQTDKEQLELAFDKLKKSSQAKLADVEAALKDERALNEERKKKMKAFVETKADELRQLQADNDALQSEVATTSKSLMDLNNRWKQLHAQWVQSQTRNRELQRDLNRIKKDSENLHKVGDSFQMKLSRSANETEEHKHKRLAAKHELMTVLRTLEAERELTNRLRDNIKFTFTPKALSQQQLIREALDEFETQLLKLSQRLSVPLPPRSNQESAMILSDNTSSAENGNASLDDDAAKLDQETQRVSQSIMSLSDNVERLRVILDMGGGRSCASVLTELFTTGTMQSSPALASDRSPMTASRMNAVRSHRYGQIPGGSG